MSLRFDSVEFGHWGVSYRVKRWLLIQYRVRIVAGRLAVSSTTFIGPNAADDLVGRELPRGWTVREKVIRGPADTGGNFSINYRVTNTDGRAGFCKVLNLWWLERAMNPIDAIAAATDAYLFERDLARSCVDLSRVVTAIDDDSVQFPEYQQPLVSYIIFEVADRDIRQLLDATDALDVAVRLRCLHNLATGLRQLHGRHVAHQDVKPSNALVFAADVDGHRVTKIGDLGRATAIGRPTDHDEYEIAGDPTYGPPEGLYRAIPDGFGPRRLACDFYQLGSMVCFVFTALPLNALLRQELHPAHLWENWRGSYADVLPYVRDAQGRAFERVKAEVPEQIRDRVFALLVALCDPDPLRRGLPVLPANRGGNPYALDRVVTELDLLSRRAEATVRGKL